MAFLLLAGIACSTGTIVDYPVHSDGMLAPYRHGLYAATEKQLVAGSEISGPDRLVFLLDRATTLHAMKNFVGSNQLLWEAEKISQVQDYEKPAKLRANNTPNIQRKYYSGEEFENMMLSVYQSLNYAMEGKDEDAINSVRTAEHKLSRMHIEGGRSYSVAPFLHYWQAILYERKRDFTEAKLHFEKAGALDPADETVAEARLRMLALAGKSEEADNLLRELGKKEAALSSIYRDARDKGIVYVLVENAFVAAKMEHPQYPDFAFYREPWVKYKSAAVFVDGEELASSRMLFDVSLLAKENYNAKLALYLKDKAAGFPNMETKLKRMADRDPTHGDIHSYERVAKLTADLRQWTTLPSNLQLARVVLYPGIHRVMLRMETEDGRRGPFRDLGEVEIKSARDTSILIYRELND